MSSLYKALPEVCPSQYFKNEALIPETAQEISKDIKKAGGFLYIVGGWVRDQLLGIESNDFDFEVYGLCFSELEKILKKFGKPKIIGKAFGVIYLESGELCCDFALPRRESKIGMGHKDFNVEHDFQMSFEEASKRRDFTVNAMGIRLPELEFKDPQKGFEDLKKGVLKHVSDAFSEDPLRVLRAAAFSSRFGFDVAPNTSALCRTLSIEHLSKERIFTEIQKILLDSEKPSIGLNAILELGQIDYFPEMKSLIGLRQDKLWHPEGDVWTHTSFVLDRASKLLYETRYEKLVVMLAALCHDFGKAVTTVNIDGRIKSPGHEKEGEKLTISFLKRLTDEKKIIEEVSSLVREHLKPWQLYADREKLTDGAVRRLSMRVDIKKLLKLAEADYYGKGLDSEKKDFPVSSWLIDKYESIISSKDKPKPFLTGKMLLELGFKESPFMGKILSSAFEQQLDGKISSTDEALLFAKKIKNNFSIS